MTRQEANKEIIKHLEELIDKYPDQRFGQLIANYAFPNYREEDLFFEESGVTLYKMELNEFV